MKPDPNVHCTAGSYTPYVAVVQSDWLSVSMLHVTTFASQISGVIDTAIAANMRPPNEGDVAPYFECYTEATNWKWRMYGECTNCCLLDLLLFHYYLYTFKV